MRWGLQILLSLLVVSLICLAVAPFTDTGTRQLVRAVNHLSPLELDYAGGRLGGELHLGHLVLATDSVQLRLDDVRAQLIPACLWRSAICFRELSAGALTLDVLPSPPGEDEDPVSPGPRELLQIPVAVETDSLTIGSAAITWPGGHWRQGALQAGIRVGGESIEVLHAVMRGVELYQAGSDEEESTEPVNLPDIDLPLDLSVDDLRLQSLSYDLAGAQGQLDSLHLKGHWRNMDLQLVELGMAAEEMGALETSGALQFQGDWPLALSAGITLPEEIPGTALAGREIRVELAGDLQQLQVSVNAAGGIESSLRGTLKPLYPGLPFDLSYDARWEGELLPADHVSLPGVLVDLELVSPATLRASGTLEKQSIELRGTASGLGYDHMTIALSGVQREGRMLVENLILQETGGGNELRASGEFDFDDALDWSLAIESAGIDLPEITEYAVGRLQGGLTLSGSLAQQSWQLSIRDADLSGEVNRLPAKVTGYGGLDSELRFAASDLSGEVNGARFGLHSSGRSGETGQLKLAVDELGRWFSGGRGRVDIEASLAGINSRLEFRGSLADVELGALSVEAGSLSGNYQPTMERDFSLDAVLSEVGLQGAELDSVRLHASGSGGEHAASLVAEGDYSGRLALEGAFTGDDWRGALSATPVDSPWGRWGLENSVPIHWSREQSGLTMAGHCWLSEQTRICPGELRLADRSAGSLKIAGDMAFLAGLFPDDVDVSGSIDLDASIAWGGGEPLILNGRTRSRDVLIKRYFGVGEQASVTWESVEAVAEQRPEGLYVAGDMIDEGKKARFSLVLPDNRETGALQGELEFDRLELATLAPLFPHLSALAGELQGTVELGGTLSSPLGRGTVTLSGGRVALLGNPTELEDLHLSLDIRDDRALVSGGGLLGGGPLTLQGELLLSPELRLEMAVTGEKHQLLLPPSAEMLVSEDLELIATTGLLDVSGEILVHKGTVRHEDLPEGSVAVSSNVVVVDYAGNVLREERPFDTRLNVWVRIEDKFLVEGGGLNAAVGGDLHVLQEPARPLQLFGNLNVVGGELSAFRQRLRIKRGTISFAGTPDNPEFNVRAEREIRGENITVGVELLGTLDAPEITVYSDPVMEHSEAMSYLVRGRGLDAGAAADGTALALSMGASVVNQSGILAGLDRIPLVSQVQFGSEGSADDTAATVSGYIGERIYIAYGVGIYEPITVLTARLYFSARLWLEVVSRLENSVDLYYSFEIR